MVTTIVQTEQREIQVYSLDLDRQKGIALDLVYIPGGRFLMGRPDSEEGDDDELLQHPVTVASFLMGQTPITQAQWAVVAQWEPVAKKLETDPSNFKGEQRPVENVSWQDALEFCARLSRAMQMDIRLPTESQWEYACRAGTTTPFHFGETLTTDLANYDGNDTYGRGPKGVYRQETTPVKQFGSNAWGLYDLHGNVWEWCLDPWHESYQDKSQKDGEVWDETMSPSQYLLNKQNAIKLFSDERSRVIRGGSWFNYPRNCRSAYRSRNNPDYINDYNGFRVVCRFPS